MSIFFDLFNPNNRNRTEELRRLENTREEEAQGEPGRGPIDLKSGMVVIRPPAKKAEAVEAEAVEPEAAEAGDSGEGGESEDDDAVRAQEDGGA